MIARTAMAAAPALLWACLAGPGIAAAGEPARLGLTPMGQHEAYFELTLAPGERHEAEVEAANFGSEAADARTYAADAYSIVNGGFGAELYGEAPGTTTRWITYPTQELHLEPGEAVRVPFAISVPALTPPGDYLAALVIESTVPMPPSGPLVLTQVDRSAIAVAITVPGPRQPALEIGGVAHRTVAGHSILAFEVDNPGNVHLRPAGTFALLDEHSSPIQRGPVSMDAVYARSGTLLEAPLSERLAPGDYCAQLSLTDAATGAEDETDCLALSVTAAVASPGLEGGGVPPPTALPSTSAPGSAASGMLLLGGYALVIAAFLLAVRRRARRGRAAPPMPESHP